MDIKPILSSLRRSPTGAILVALQIALALAIVVNSLFIIVQRFEKVNRDPGIDVPNIFFVGWAPSGDKFQGEVTIREDLQILRSLPGVAGGDGRQCRAAVGRRLEHVDVHRAQREGPARRHELFPGRRAGRRDVRRQAGRRDATSMRRSSRSRRATVRRRRRRSCVTRDVAKELFPKESALGKTVYTGTSDPVTIVGIIDHMHGSWPGWDKVGNVALFPVITDETYARYMVRAKPGQRDAMMKLAEEALEQGRQRPRDPEGALAGVHRGQHLRRRPRHGRVPRRRHCAAAGHFRARHLRTGGVQRQHAHQADRHPAGGRRPPHRHPAVLPGRELVDHDRWAWSWAASWRWCSGTGSARRSNSRA